MRVSSKMIKGQDKGNISMITVTNMQDNGKKESNLEMEHIFGKMVENMLECGKMIAGMDME